MKKHKKNVLDILILLLVGVITFAFLSFVNWSINFHDWNGFSRFILGAVGVGIVFKIFDTLDIL